MVRDHMLKMTGVTKKFPGVTALSNVNFQLGKGEVHALVGANGAGKSTLIKVLAGAHRPEEGTIELKGEQVYFENPSDAKKRGIGVIYQEFTLLPELDVAKNIFYASEPTYGAGLFVNWKRVYEDARRLIDKFGLNLDVTAKVSSLSTAAQQMVEIAKALSLNAEVLVMDEPTATLTVHEVERLFEIIKDLKSRGVSIIYISHRLEEILEICDKLTVLRSGTMVGGMDIKDATKDNIISMMIGNAMQKPEKPGYYVQDETALEIKGLSNENVTDIHLNVRKGEVIGLAGLVGAGRTELVRALFGADPIREGQIIVNGKSVTISSPRQAIQHRIGLLPESRKEQGLLMNLNVRRNTTFATLKKFSRGPFISKQREKHQVKDYITRLKIKTPDTEFMVVNLSGGNQQKIVLAKWLCNECNILILDEPTRGVDVPAKEEIFQEINNLVKSGKSIIFISSELDEILRVSDRIYTMYKGRITGELDRESVTMNTMMHLITGGDQH